MKVNYKTSVFDQIVAYKESAAKLGRPIDSVVLSKEEWEVLKKEIPKRVDPSLSGEPLNNIFGFEILVRGLK